MALGVSQLRGAVQHALTFLFTTGVDEGRLEWTPKVRHGDRGKIGKACPSGTLSRLLERLQDQLLHPPIQQLGDVEFIHRQAGDFVDPSELLELLARLVQYPALAHMTYVIGSVHLDLKSIRIIELERFL